MKKMLILFICLVFAAGVVAADPVEGFWASVDDETGKITAYWKIYTVGSELRGEIVKVPGQADSTVAGAVNSSYPGHPVSGDLSTKPVIGTPWIYGLSQKKEGEWHRGTIIDVGNGPKYNCSITFHPEGSRIKRGMNAEVDTLEMRGTIGLGIGKSQYWIAVDESDIPN